MGAKGNRRVLMRIPREKEKAVREALAKHGVNPDLAQRKPLYPTKAEERKP